jgi:iron complex outermembrane receptor protein
LGADAQLAGGSLRADLAIAARDFGAADFYAPFQSYEKTRTTTIAAGWVRGTGRFTIDPRFHARRHTDDFILKRDDPAFYRNQHTAWQLGGELTGRLVLSQTATAAFGVEAAQDRIDSNALGNRQEARGAAFAEVEAGRMGSHVVQLGFRTDWHETYGSFIAPSIAAALWPSPSLRLRASAGRSFRAPGWTERYYRDPANIGSPTLDPERAWAAELGAELTSGQMVRIDLVGFIRHADALIDWAKPVGAVAGTPFRTMNVEDATFTGLEGSIEVLALGTRWKAAGTVLSLSADEATGFTSKYALRPLTQSAILAASRPLGRHAQVAVQGRHGRRRPVALTPGSGEDHYLLFDARIALTAAGVRLYMDATNLLDDEYLDVSVRPGPGRAFRVGITWALED